jgi:ferrous-iron efflux pump FieF
MRTAGADHFVKFNLHLDENLTIREAHEISDIIENDLKKIVERLEIYIHIEPDSEFHNSNEIEDILN